MYHHALIDRTLLDIARARAAAPWRLQAWAAPIRLAPIRLAPIRLLRQGLQRMGLAAAPAGRASG